MVIKLVWLWRNNYSSHFFVTQLTRPISTCQLTGNMHCDHIIQNSWSHLFKTVIILSAYPGSGRCERETFYIDIQWPCPRWHYQLYRHNNRFCVGYIILYTIKNVKIMKLIMWRTIRRRYIHCQYPVKWTRNSVWITK